MLLSLAGLASAPAAAEEWDLCANRPGLASDGCVLPAGALQLETGLVSWTRDRADGVTATELSLAPSMLRWGVAAWVELRAAWSPLVRHRERGSGGHASLTGAGDLDLGAKARLTADDAPVRVALEPTLTVPVGSRAFSQGTWSLQVALPFDTDLGGGLYASATPQLAALADGDGRGRHPGGALAASLGAGLTERWSLAVDIAHDWDFDPAGTSRAAAVGLSSAWMATERLQLDAEAIAGIGGDAADLTLSAGFAFRF